MFSNLRQNKFFTIDSPITSNGNHTEERKLAHGKLGVGHIITGDEPHLPVSLRNDQEAALLGMQLGKER